MLFQGQIKDIGPGRKVLYFLWHRKMELFMLILTEVVLDVLRHFMSEPSAGFPGIPGNVRAQEQPLGMPQMHERAVGRKGLFNIYIQGGSCDNSIVQRACKVVFYGYASPAGIHQNGRRFHLFELLIPDEAGRALVVGRMDGNDIGLGQ